MTYKISENTSAPKFIKVAVCDVHTNDLKSGQPITQRLEFLDRKDSVGVLIYHEDQKLFTWVEQFRIGLATKAERQEDAYSIEPVAGMIEPGQTPKDAALREAVEETDCAIKELTPVSSFFMCPGISNERMHLFIATTSGQVLADLGGLEEEREQIKVHHWTFEQTNEAFKSGRLNNAHAQMLWQHVLLNYPQWKPELSYSSDKSDFNCLGF